MSTSTNDKYTQRRSPSTPTLTPRNPINLNVFIHRDLHNHFRMPSLHTDYFSWLEMELEDISGRKVLTNFPGSGWPTELIDFNYKGDYKKRVDAWERAIIQHLTDRSITPAPLDLYLLVTRDAINDQTAGSAYQKGRFGIASTASFSTPAHEVGHMLDARHEDGESIFNLRWQTTLMKRRTSSSPASIAYRFSDKNRNNIRTYLSRFE